jgi:hypothetical protein
MEAAMSTDLSTPPRYGFASDLVYRTGRPFEMVLRVLLAEMHGGRFRMPYRFGAYKGKEALFLRLQHAMDVVQVPVKSHRLEIYWCLLCKPYTTTPNFRAWLIEEGYVLTRAGQLVETERTIDGRRVAHMAVFDLQAMRQDGIEAAIRPQAS